MSDTTRDHLTRRCPMLGHEIPFSYCRSPGQETPCRKILDCWWETFDVAAFMRAAYGPAAIEALQAPPPPRALTILELARQAQGRMDA